LDRPVKAIYIDYKNIDWNNPANTVLNAIQVGYNVIILAFYLSSGPADMAIAWQGVPSGTQQSTAQQAHAKNAIILVSFGGATDDPYRKDPIALGAQVAKWAVDNNLDGVDFDLENFGPGLTADGLNPFQTASWVANISNSARNVLGSGKYISHAPQGPYFGPVGSTNTWAGVTGGYTGVYYYATNIDFFNVQFYNQGPSCYTDYNGLFTSSCSTFPSTSVLEIAKAGIPMEKIVVGKIVNPSDGGTGWVSATDLHNWFSQARSEIGWNSGVMGWVWDDANTLAQWISTIFP